ncbi:hypothetical protein CR513_09994, partial [Mucuna pruriens]
MLATPLVLTRPTLGIPLLVYISMTNDVISGAIVQEKEGSQCPSLTRSGKEVLEDRKGCLHPYNHFKETMPLFQGYHIIRPNRLTHPENTTKVGPNEENGGTVSNYLKRRGHIKAQALADFITKLALIGRLGNEGREWLLFIDRASNQSGRKVGIILEGPKGVLIEQSLRFEFKASSNQAEYETLLARMRLAKELDA